MDHRAPAGLDPARLIADPPAEDYGLLELALAWPDLDAAQERIAATLRLFVITRDPLDWIPRRGHAWATANADGDVLERIMRAQESNPAGWRAMGKASARISGLPDTGGLPLPQRREASPGRNDPCPCGSGLKYKHCCGA